jgi:hypothetical protein
MFDAVKNTLSIEDVSVSGDLADILAKAPSRGDLIRSLSLGDPSRVSNADITVLSTMTGSVPGRRTIKDLGDLLAVDEDAARVKEALDEYDKDLSFLRDMVDAGFQPIAAAVKVAVSGLRLDPPAAGGGLAVRAVLSVKDAQEADELQRLVASVSFIQVDGSDEQTALQVYLFSPTNLAWGEFQRAVNDSQTNIFTSGFSPIRSVAARKVRLAARLCRYLSAESKNKTGDTINYMIPDFLELKSSKSDWQRLVLALSGVKVKAKKSSAALIVDQADRGDGGMTGAAKDGRRFMRASRMAHDMTRASTLDNAVGKGNVLETLDMISAAIKDISESASVNKVNKVHSEAFVIQFDGKDEQVYPSIFKALQTFLASYRSPNNFIHGLINKSNFESMKSSYSWRQTSISETMGPRLVRMVDLTESVSKNIKDAWTDFDALVDSVRTVRGLIHKFLSEAPAEMTLDLSAVLKAQMAKNETVVSEGRAGVISRLAKVTEAAAEMRALLIEIDRVSQEEKAKDFNFNEDLYRLFARNMSTMASQIEDASRETTKLLSGVLDESDSMRVNSALSQFLIHYAVEKEIPIHEMESALLKATAMESVDWKVGQREDFPEWMYDSAAVKDRFGLKATEFGASISKSKGQQRNALLKASVSLDDMSQIFGVDPKDLSLDGRISISIGARGKQSAIAYYDVKRSLLAFKNGEQGDGSFIHEWFHAFDMTGTGQSALHRSKWTGDEIDDDVQGAIRNVRRAIVSGSRSQYERHIDVEFELAKYRHQQSVDRLERFLQVEAKKFDELARQSIASILATSRAAIRHIETPLADFGIALDPQLFFEKIYGKVSGIRATNFKDAGLKDFLDDSSRIPGHKRMIEQTLRVASVSEDEIDRFVEAAAPFLAARNECLDMINALSNAVNRLYDNHTLESRGIVKTYEAAVSLWSMMLQTLTKAKDVVKNSMTYNDFHRKMSYHRLPPSLVIPGDLSGDMETGWPSKMILDSSIADGSGRGKPYYATMAEMGARAFEVYGVMKMNAAGLTNTFLIDERRANPTRDETDLQIYPSGSHAEEIERAFDELFQVLKRKGRLAIR